MFGDKRILGIIPARGGSKGVPRKNLRMVDGKPLVGRTIEMALGSRYIDRLILSSEDQEIIETARDYGCEVPFVRPKELSLDESVTRDVILHVMEALGEKYDLVVCLQVTSPLVTSDDIDGTIRTCVEKNTGSCVSVCKVDKSPYWMFKMPEEGILSPLMGDSYLTKRRQELPQIYIPNGAVFVVMWDWFLEHKTFYGSSTAGYVMPGSRSIDVDTENDFMMLEFLMKNGAI